MKTQLKLTPDPIDELALIAEREMKVQMLYPERVASLDAERRRRVNA